MTEFETVKFTLNAKKREVAEDLENINRKILEEERVLENMHERKLKYEDALAEIEAVLRVLTTTSQERSE